MSLVWKIKAASGCRYVQDFASSRAVPVDLSARKILKTAFPAINEQTSSTISKPPKKVDIDIFGVRQNRLSLQKLRKHYELRLKPTFKAKLIRKKLKFFNGISFLCHRLLVQVHALTPNIMIKLSFDLFQLIVPIRDIFNIGF